MLDVSLQELTRRAQEYVFSRETRIRVYQRHHVLQLVAETEGAPRLVVSAAGPKTTRQSLIHQPAIGHYVNGLVWRFYLHCAKGLVPVLPNRLERVASGSGPPEPECHFAGVVGIPTRAEPENDLTLLTVGKLKGDLDGGAGVQSRPYPAGKPRTGHRSRILKCAVSSKELSPVAAHGTGRIIHVEECGPVRELRIIGVPRE